MKWNDDIILVLPFEQLYRRGPMFYNSAIVYPQATSGILWIGTVCNFDYNATRASNTVPSIRIDDVSFVRIGCGVLDQVKPIITPIVSLLSTVAGIVGGAGPTSV
jgi:hypothetical protein